MRLATIPLLAVTLVACGSICELRIARLPAEFPQKAHPYVSSDLQFEVLWREAREGLPHRLILRSRADNLERELMTFDRHVGVFWSPDNSRVMVTDFESSDRASTYIYSVKQSAPLNLKSELRGQAVVRADVFANHHCYLVGERWLSPNQARLRLWGYGDVDPNGFDFFLDYDLKNRTFVRAQAQ